MNRELVEAFQRVHADRDTGTIEAVRGERALRFYFEQGELMLLDYCEEKEHALLRQYRDYHKIGPELEAVCRQMIPTGTRVKDFLLNQQVVTSEEVAQVTRSLVEDTLCDWFEEPTDSVAWRPELGREAYDLDRRAVKLRIQVEVLLDMLQERIAERRAVRQQVPDNDRVFALEEDAPSTGRLNDMERNLLQVIDGKRTVGEIAQAVRESDLNTAIFLTSLLNQGYIVEHQTRESGTLSSGGHPAIAAAPGSRRLEARRPGTGREQATSDPQRASAVIEDFEVTVRPSRPRSRAPVLILLVALLLVVGWAFYLVMETRRREAVIDRLSAEIENSIAARDWLAAEQSLVDAYQQAGEDVVLVERLDDFLAARNQRFAGEIERMAAAVEAERLDEAERIDQGLPADPDAVDDLWDAQLAARLEAVRSEWESRAAALAEEVRLFRRSIEALLDGGNLEVALERIAAARPAVAAAGRAALDEWRARLIREAGEERRSLGDRERRLEHASRADATPEQMATIERLRSELAAERTRLQEQIARLADLVEAGAVERAQRLIGDLEARVAGSDLSNRVAALSQALADVRNRATTMREEAERAILDSNRRSGFQDLAERIVALREQFPELDDDGQLLATAQVLGQVERASQQEEIDRELAILASVGTEQVPEAIAQAISARRTALATVSERAAAELERARELAATGDFAAAERSFRAISERSEFSRTPAVQSAREGLAEMADARRQREARLGALRSAMLIQDLDAVTRLARELALPRLPILITSEPAGAEIRRDGEVVGTTPWIEEELGAERLGYEYRIVLPGYRPAEVAAAGAAGGWRIAVELERAPLARQQLSHNVTNHPAVVDGALWLVGSRHLARVAPDDASSLPFDGSVATTRPLRNPVYAPAQATPHGLAIATRDRLLLRVADGEVRREPMAVSTDHAVALYRSPVVIDRVLAIAGDREGNVVASDLRDGTEVWRAVGAPIAAAPQLVDSVVLIVRRDGQWQRLGADTGEVVESGRLGASVVAAWPEDGGLVAIAGRTRHRWSGLDRPTRSPASESNVLSAGSGCLITADRRVHLVAEDGALTRVGVLPPEVELRSLPLAWAGHVAVAFGQRTEVYGPRGFSVEGETEMLAPAVLDGRLAVVEVGGVVRWYEE